MFPTWSFKLMKSYDDANVFDFLQNNLPTVLTALSWSDRDATLSLQVTLQQIYYE
jgi:hypothetical protein